MNWKYIKHRSTPLILYLTISFALGLPGRLAGQSYAKVGIVGAQFLKIGVGAKSLGMGSSAMAVVDDAQSIFWNPGGLTSISNYSVYVSHTNWLADINYEAVALAKNLGKFGTVGLSFSYLSSGEMDVTTYDQQDGTGETFGYTDIMLGATWARTLTDRFSFGGTVKLVMEDYGVKDDIEGKQISVKSLAFDIGTQYITGLRSLKMGLAIQNFGPELKPAGKYADITGFDSDAQDYIRSDDKSFKAYPMPMVFSVGIAFDAVDRPGHKITLASDVIHPSDNVERINVGAQYTMFNVLSVRAGSMYSPDRGDNYAERLTFGMGIKVGSIVVDYAFLDYSIINVVHTLSIGFNY